MSYSNYEPRKEFDQKMKYVLMNARERAAVESVSNSRSGILHWFNTSYQRVPLAPGENQWTARNTHGLMQASRQAPAAYWINQNCDHYWADADSILKFTAVQCMTLEEAKDACEKHEKSGIVEAIRQNIIGQGKYADQVNSIDKEPGESIVDLRPGPVYRKPDGTLTNDPGTPKTRGQKWATDKIIASDGGIAIALAGRNESCLLNDLGSPQTLATMQHLLGEIIDAACAEAEETLLAVFQSQQSMEKPLKIREDTFRRDLAANLFREAISVRPSPPPSISIESIAKASVFSADALIAELAKEKTEPKS